MNTLASKRSMTLTADDFYDMGDAGAGYELVDGKLDVNPMSAKSCRVGGKLYNKSENYCEQQPGWAFPQESGYRCFVDDPNRVRKPDASYIALDRMTAEDYESLGFIRIVPDLVVEVISPKDIASKVESKIDQWLEAGVKVVWVVYPNQKRVREHRPDGSVRHFHESDVLTEPTILPGFACTVADLFLLPSATRTI